MKRYLLLVLSFVFFIASQAMGAVYYVDFENGNDTTGDGTYGTPWATIEKCTTSGATTGGDECRVAKHTPTALSGTLTFTNGSTSVSTSADLTGDISAGDYVGLNDTDESWWRVASLTSSVITLDYEYWGPGTGVASTGYLADYTMLTGDVDMESSGTSTESRLKISGGWDLATQTQDGMTFLSNYGQTFNFVNYNGEDFIELSSFVMFASTASSYAIETASAYGLKFDNLIWTNSEFSFSGNGNFNNWLEYSNIIQSGGTSDRGFDIYGVDFIKASNLISYSPSSGGTEDGIDISANYLIIDGVEVYNAGYNLMSLQGRMITIKNAILDTNNYGSVPGLGISNVADVFIDGIQIKNTTGNGIYCSGSEIANLHINNPVFTNISSADIKVYWSAAEAHNPPVYVSNYNGTAGDDRMYFKSYNVGNYIYRDTTDARSGSCLKFYPYYSGYPITFKVGEYQVEDGSSNATLSVYMKDNATFDGVVKLWVQIKKGFSDMPIIKTMTTSYVEQSITVDAADISTGDHISLWVMVSGSAGNVFVDDFSATQ